MKQMLWPDWMTRPWAMLTLGGVSVLGVAYGFMLLMRLFFAPLLRFELRHYGFAVLNAAALTLAIVPSLYWLILRRLRRSEALLQQAIGAMLDALVITDAQDRVIEWNAAAERMFQYTRTEALGKTVHQQHESVGDSKYGNATQRQHGPGACHPVRP